MKDIIKGPAPLNQERKATFKNIGKDPSEFELEYQIGDRAVYFNQGTGERICFFKDQWASSEGEKGTVLKQIIGIAVRAANGHTKAFTVTTDRDRQDIKDMACELIRNPDVEFGAIGDVVRVEDTGTEGHCWNLSPGGRLIRRCGSGCMDWNDPTIWREFAVYSVASDTAMRELELADMGEDGELLRLVLEDLGILWNWDGPAEERVEHAATLIRPSGLVVLEKWYDIETEEEPEWDES